MATTARMAIEIQLQAMELKIKDAKKRLVNATDAVVRRANGAHADVERMLMGESCSVGSIDLMAGDVHEAQEAKDELQRLFSQLSTIRWIASKPDATA